MILQDGCKYAFILGMNRSSEKTVDALGGPTAVARLCHGKVTPQAVSQWKENGIPAGWSGYLRLLKPEVFAELDDSRNGSCGCHREGAKS